MLHYASISLFRTRYGRVYKGFWGHLPVAIKVLRVPIDELETGIREDFDREVSAVHLCVPSVRVGGGGEMERDEHVLKRTS